MNQKATMFDAGQRAGITSAAALAAPAYGSSNPPFSATNGVKTAKAMLIEVEGSGAGTADVTVTLYRGNPLSSNVTIADDLKLAGVWVMKYAGAAQKRSFVVDTDCCDIGAAVTVSAINCTVVVKATALDLQ